MEDKENVNYDEIIRYSEKLWRSKSEGGHDFTPQIEHRAKDFTKPRHFTDDLISMAPSRESNNFSSPPPVYDTISRGTSYQPPVSVPAKSTRPVVSEKGKQQYTDSLNKSVGPKKAVPTSQKKEATKEEISLTTKAFKVILSVVAMAALFIGGLVTDFTSDMADFFKVNEYLSQYSYIASEGTIHARNGTLNYWYEEGLMGEKVAEAADPEAALYAVYSDIDYLQRTVVQNVYSEAVSRNPDLFGGHDNFKSYVGSLGCVDKDGEIDYDEYERISQERILAKATLDQYTEQATAGK